MASSTNGAACSRARAGTAVHDGLYVADGSVIPTPVGINPSLVISAVAERTAALIAADRGWTVDWGPGPVTPPSAAVPLARAGLEFTERMAGSIDLGKGHRSDVEFVVTISTDNLDALLQDAASPGRIRGTVTAPALSSTPLRVTSGTFQLLADDPTLFETKQMRYSMELSSIEGGSWRLEGYKVIHHDATFDLWADTTTLFTTISEGAGPGGAVVGTGTLIITLADFVRLLRTMKVTGIEHDTERLEYLGRFGREFAGNLFRIYGGVFAESSVFDKVPSSRSKRALRTPTPEVFDVRTNDNVHVRLTRYQGGTKGPVIMAPGFGVSTLSFSTDTVETNLPEYLVEHGYDAWLFDYRASPVLPSAKTRFSLDDVAQRDWPAAIDKVLEVSGKTSVQPLVHCIGSMTFLMGMLSGRHRVRPRAIGHLLAADHAPADQHREQAQVADQARQRVRERRHPHPRHQREGEAGRRAARHGAPRQPHPRGREVPPAVVPAHLRLLRALVQAQPCSTTPPTGRSRRCSASRACEPSSTWARSCRPGRSSTAMATTPISFPRTSNA